MIKAVIFDMDDTLFPEIDYIISGFKAVDRHVNLSIGLDGFYDKAMEFFNNGIRGNIFNLALEELDYKFNKDFIETLIKVYREHLPIINLFSDAHWALSNLKDHYKLGLITDGYLISQKNKASALNLYNIFDTLIFSDEYGRENWKPSPVPYLKIMDKLNFKGNELIYIGDNSTKDFVTAKRLGWYTIQVIRKNGEYFNNVVEPHYEADIKVKSLFEIASVLEDLTSTVYK
jgi:putative hydrolase of the HAD superfamily